MPMPRRDPREMQSPPPDLVEISPLLSYAGEGLTRLVDGRRFDSRTVLLENEFDVEAQSCEQAPAHDA